MVAYVYKEQLGAIVWETIITCKWLLVSDKGISGQMFRKKELLSFLVTDEKTAHHIDALGSSSNDN